MGKHRIWIWAGVTMAAPVHSAVTGSSDHGFAVENSVHISADAATVYRLLGQPGRWWNGQHTYSGDAANLSLDPVAGGCFCEKVPGKDGRPGSVEHGRVIQAQPDRQLRLSGALGPLQAEAVTGTLTFDIAPDGEGARVGMSYVVGGYLRTGAAGIAPIVDRVLAEQLQGLKRAAEAGGQ
ncbi:SRPBCC family protein [Sphingobium sp. SA916]|uniref:SRPBCC family protein n=1 Tax=Sphingobium sp. SA916 TaxID=1851207 RepID=UPI000C9F2BF3|nr:ATPase [Sphingobium sp. SA916]